MYNFILHIFIMSSLGVIVYFFGRAIPRVSDIEENIQKDSFQSRLDNLIAKIPFDKIDIVFSTFIEKTLRKIKLLLMKWDNIVTSHINKMRKISNGGFGEGEKEEKQSLFIPMDKIENESVGNDEIK